jgi:hypothetical protein
VDLIPDQVDIVTTNLVVTEIPVDLAQHVDKEHHCFHFGYQFSPVHADRAPSLDVVCQPFDCVRWRLQWTLIVFTHVRHGWKLQRRVMGLERYGVRTGEYVERGEHREI